MSVIDDIAVVVVMAGAFAKVVVLTVGAAAVK